MPRVRRIALLALGAIVMLAVTAFAAAQIPHDEGLATTGSALPSRSATASPSDASASAATPSSALPPTATVVAIGDSIMDGHGVKPSRAWPEVVADESDWQLTDLATDGSGFVAVGDDGDTFQDQAAQAVALHPSIILIAGSSNDLDEDPAEVADAISSTLAFVHDQLPDTRVIALNTFWGSDPPPAELAAIDEDVVTAAAATGAHYLDIGQPLSGRPDLMQSDNVHPTAHGLKVLAAAIVSAIRAEDG